MEVSSYDIVKRIIMTEKSGDLFNRKGKITLEVAKDANKVVVRKAVEKIWDVRVSKVCIMNTPGKTKRFGRRPYFSPGKKKAIVTLQKGYKIEFPGQFESAGTEVAAEGR